MTTIRIVLFAILLLGMIGSGVELILLDHTEDWRQWIPLILIGLGLVASGWHGLQSTARSVRVLRAIFIGFIASGLAGIYFHYQGSAEFKLESNPSLRGWPLFWAAVKGKAPPLLAPGASRGGALARIASRNKAQPESDGLVSNLHSALP